MIALRLYRALPKSYRLRLVQLLPPQRQLWLVRRLIRVAPQRTRAQIGGLRQINHRGVRMRAKVVEQTTPLELWQLNLQHVTRVLDNADIDYFCVRPGNELRSAVAVRIDRKGDVLRALASSAGAEVTVRIVNRAGKTVSPKHPRALIQVFHPVTDPGGTAVHGVDYACEIEFWRQAQPRGALNPTLVAPRGNQVAESLPVPGDVVTVPASRLTGFAPERDDAKRYRTRTEFASLGYQDVTFPIDAVYTWVDGDDADWRRRKNDALRGQEEVEISSVAANASRYVSRDELRYSLRSIVAFLPWIRQIYLVTDDQVPSWLDVANPMVKVVRHREIFGSTGRLPTFNSHAIESRLHRIPGLSEHFIYVNDDMFFGRPLLPTTFFYANGLAKFFPSPAKLDIGPATVDDAPVTAAGKNNRRHIEERFGRTITQKMRHVPYPLRKSVLEQIERDLQGEVLATAEHQFRHPEDLSIPSSLQHYWSFLSGKAVPGSISYAYADLAHPSTPVRLAMLLRRRDCDVFCLNDTDTAEVALSEQHKMLAEFLPAYFPFRAPFELPVEVETQRAQMTSTALAEASLSPSAVPAQRTTDTAGFESHSSELVG